MAIVFHGNRAYGLEIPSQMVREWRFVFDLIFPHLQKKPHMNRLRQSAFPVSVIFILTAILSSCSDKKPKPQGEHIRLEKEIDSMNQDTLNAVRGNVTFSQIQTFPSQVILTGIPQHRLVTIYKTRTEIKDRSFSGEIYYYKSYDEDEDEDRYSHFMPGIDLLYGYNLLRIAHYDLKTEELNFLFDHPVLVKSLYYPSFIQDSLNRKPINRDYYLVSAYDEDTNRDTLINKSDLRRFYHFDSSGKERTQIIPADYSVERSQYDSMNDVMFIFARHDSDHNGQADKKEPVHIYWIDLKKPDKGKRLY